MSLIHPQSSVILWALEYSGRRIQSIIDTRLFLASSLWVEFFFFLVCSLPGKSLWLNKLCSRSVFTLTYHIYWENIVSWTYQWKDCLVQYQSQGSLWLVQNNETAKVSKLTKLHTVKAHSIHSVVFLCFSWWLKKLSIASWWRARSDFQPSSD